VQRVTALELAPDLRTVLAPLREALERLAPLIDQADRWVRQTAAADPVAQRLMTVPGVGGVVALSYQTALETPARFGGDAGRASAYLGLVPSEHSSGEGHRKGAITKAGPRMVRSLLVQAAWTLWRQRRRVAHLYAWVEQVAARRGRRIAVIALARRVSRILYAIWRDETVFRVATVAA